MFCEEEEEEEDDDYDDGGGEQEALADTTTGKISPYGMQTSRPSSIFYAARLSSRISHDVRPQMSQRQ
jgi:hypothetical protein